MRNNQIQIYGWGRQQPLFSKGAVSQIPETQEGHSGPNTTDRLTRRRQFLSTPEEHTHETLTKTELAQSPRSQYI